ncbi:acyl-CoA dehydrogenase family protein [Arthrobacter sp. 4R501]|uniref:acyl-CoA dehydrogenase family protein n=1 Tax=Arthrobacter sp. 4R501 TaxID=2058886 RepID=UPI000CE47088|nr:acyl-CoA dehydrogenase family protein [Arthrobacter sp. 4R501]
MPASSHQPVRMVSTQAELAWTVPLLDAVASAAGNVPVLLSLARDAGGSWPLPGGGHTARLWELLASVSAVDVAAGRVFEPHMDAQAILAQAGKDQTGNSQPRLDPAGLVPADRAGAWGVFAAEGPGLRLDAKTGDTGILLSGSKPWCSLAPLLDRAVITAHTESGGRAAFAVDLRHPGMTCEEPAWVARGLREIPSGTVHFSHVPAQQLGNDGWYFSRPGFAWGGMGVAACWLGGAVGVARDYKDSLAAAAECGREPDQIALAALGEADRILTAALQYLARTAALIDDGSLSNHGSLSAGEDTREAVEGKPAVDRSAWSEALRVRGTVVAAVERVLSLVSRNRGPAPLAFDEPYAKRMADLTLYVRQHHAMRDDAQLGRLTLKGEYLW